MFDVAKYKEHLSGYLITDAAIRSKEFFYFAARNEAESVKAGVLSEPTVTKRLISCMPYKPKENRLGSWEFEGYPRFFVGGTQVPASKGICVTTSGDVMASGGGTSEVENPIPKGKDGPRRGAIRRIRMIEGRLYVAGTGHTVCRRRGPNDWESLCLDLPLGTRAEHADEKKSEDMAFNDIDGFGPDDLYAVAGRGVVWHCDGKAWRRIAFPSNMLLESVCCAGDGHVYIGAQSGTLFRGRNNNWTLLHRGQFSLPFKDIVWHAGRLWCTSDYGLWTVEGDKLTEVQLPSSDIAVCAGNLSAADGVMLMAGIHGAAFHDGKEWQLIFNRYKMEQAVAGA